MGKAKKKKQNEARTDPIGLGAASNGASNGDVVAQRTEDEIIANIVDQLQSSNPEDKVCGCSSLGNLANDSVIKKLLLTQKIVRVVGPLLLEADGMVQLAAAGALRNISALDPDTAEEMVNQDVMTPLEQFLASFQQKSADPTEEDIGLLTEGFNLLWNLVEASPTAFSLFTASNLLDFSLSLLSGDATSTHLAMAVLNLLSSACDQNKEASARVVSCQSSLEALLVNTNLGLRVTASLLLVTVLEEAVFESKVFPKIMEIMFDTLAPDTRSTICEVSSSAPVDEQMELDLDQEQQEDNKFKGVEELLGSQQTALEILTNLCSTGEDEQWQNTDSDDEDEIEDVEDMDDEGVENVNAASPQFTEAVTSLKLFSTILEKANPLPENVAGILKSSKKGRKVLKDYESIRIRTFLCLSNLLESLSLDDVGGAEVLFSTWNSLGNILVQSKEEKLLESASSCMRSVTSKLCRSPEGAAVMNLSEKELEAIVQVGQTTQVAEIRMNMVNIIGDIAVMLSANVKETATATIFRVLVGWLVDGGCKDPDVRVVAESLDKLFDAFSEDHTDAIFFPLNLITKLRGILNALKIKMAAQKKELSQDDLGVINMAKLNLQRFIKYKEKRPKI